MIQRLIILGLLKKESSCGYDIKKYLKTDLGIFAQVQSQSIYYPLKKMEKEGLIRKKESAASSRFGKTVYSITARGEKEFIRLCRKTLCSQQRPFIESDIALYFLPFLDAKEVIPLLRLRLRFLENVKKWLIQKEHEFSRGPKNLSLMLTHHFTLAGAEKEFIEKMIQLMRKR